MFPRTSEHAALPVSQNRNGDTNVPPFHPCRLRPLVRWSELSAGRLQHRTRAQTARYMNFESLDNLTERRSELQDVIRAWCDMKDS
ncbi:MAG: hypothetical protein DWG82_00890 [Chloroflexi bacterium]|nr:hypothetical protein [Chloroflexota bacterium]